jgi:flagellar biogenesis protein FliO
MRSRLCVVGFVGLVLLSGCALAFAQNSQPSAEGHSSLYYLLQAAVSLAIVVGLIYAIYFGLRRLSQAGPTHKGDRLHVVESRHLGGGRWVYILEVANRILIVGGGSEGLRKLAELSADEFEQSQSLSDQQGATGDGTSS